MAETPQLAAQIARAIVHLNFSEPDEARNVLLEALADINFSQISKSREESHGNATA